MAPPVQPEITSTQPARRAASLQRRCRVMPLRRPEPADGSADVSASERPADPQRVPNCGARTARRTGLRRAPRPRPRAVARPGHGHGRNDDLIRPGFNAAEVIGHLEEMFTAVTAVGAHVATITPGAATGQHAQVATATPTPRRLRVRPAPRVPGRPPEHGEERRDPRAPADTRPPGMGEAGLPHHRQQVQQTQNRTICAPASALPAQTLAANSRRYTGDRRSLNPPGRITPDTRVIIASFSVWYAEMITRVSLDMRAANLLSAMRILP